jgi:hypothetical protein
VSARIVDLEALRIQQEFYQIEEGARVDALRGARREERAACAELVREMVGVERGVGATWKQEAREMAPGADDQHLRYCMAIGYAHQQFAERLEALAAEIEARKS